MSVLLHAGALVVNFKKLLGERIRRITRDTQRHVRTDDDVSPEAAT